MITSFDDYCVHQTAAPVAQPAQSDRNFYDRYWFNGIDGAGNFLFEIGFGLYPNRHIMDGHFSVTLGATQYAFHGSRRAPRERAETMVGPLSVEIIAPMRQVRVRLEKNQHNIECDLLFTAASIPHEEPQNLMYDGGHLIMHNSRFTQMGYWSGYFQVDDERVVVERAYGTRDKSWGVRPVGEPQGGAPGLLAGEPGCYWCWNPINFGDICTQMGTFEDHDGQATQLSGDLLPLYDNSDEIPHGEDTGLIKMTSVEHNIVWEKGTRRAASAEVRMLDREGRDYHISIQPMLRFQMLGIGYNHASWGHAFWKGELETGREQWDLDSMDPLEYQNLHVHLAVKAQMGQRSGIGTLETIVIGRHDRSGFKELFDGAN